MRTPALAIALATFVVQGTPALTAQAASGSPVSLPAARASDLSDIADKLSSLARVVPDSVYDWRPMEGVRSFREALALVAAEAEYFPAEWDLVRRPDAHGPFRETIGRRTRLSSREIAEVIERSFAAYAGVVAADTSAALDRVVDFGGRPTTVRTASLMLTMDMHEHLGQLVAYSRQHRLVPPWSRR